MILDNSPLHKLLYEWLLQSNNDYFNTDDAADYLLSHGATIQHWISVNDMARWPSVDNVKSSCIPVLITDGKRISDGRFEIEYDWDGEHDLVNVVLYSHSDWIYDDDITHWMPMPPLPQQEDTR